MAEGEPQASSRIFISYRRDDAAGEAGRLADHLSRRFGTGAVFLDIETIDPGTDFVSVLQTTLAQTAAVLVIVGTRWSSLPAAPVASTTNTTSFDSKWIR